MRAGLHFGRLGKRSGQRQQGRHAPIFLRLELLNFALALNNQAHGHRLHAAGTQALGDFQTEKRAELVAHNTVEKSARLLGSHPVHVNITGIRERFLDSPLGNLVKGHAPDALLIQSQGFFEVPGNRLPFAVRVGGQVDGIRLGRLLLEGCEDVFAVLQRLVGRHPALVDIDAEALVRQIAHMPLAGRDFELGAQVFVNGLRLGRRFHDD